MNKKGYLDGLEILLLVVVIGFVLFLVVIVPYASNVERKLFNTQYGTDYSFKEYFFASDMIKNYMDVGKKQRLDIDLNKNKEKTDTIRFEVK